MYYRLLLSYFSFTMLAVLSCYSQETFHRTYGLVDSDVGQYGGQTFDGGYIIAGSTVNYGLFGTDILLVKLDRFGDKEWVKTYGGDDSDYAFSVKQTSDGGYIIVGYSRSFSSDWCTSNWCREIYLIRTDDVGDTMWTKTYSGTDTDEGFDVEQTNDGGFIVASTTKSFGNNNSHIGVIKTDADGSLIWSRAYGGMYGGWGFDVELTSDGGYVFLGTEHNFDANTKSDIFVVKTDSIGDTLWTRTYGGSENEMCGSIIQTPDGGYAIVGGTLSFGQGDEDGLLIKLDVNGILLWATTFGDSLYERGQSIEATFDNGFIIGGTTKSFGFGNDDVYVVRMNDSGEVLWSKTYGGPFFEGTWCVKPTSDSGFAIFSSYGNFPPTGMNDVWLIKTDSDGNAGCVQTDVLSLVTDPTSQMTVIAGSFIYGAGFQTNDVGSNTESRTLDEYIACITCDSLISGFTYSDSLLAVSFEDTSLSANNWFWDFGDGQYDSIENPKHTFGNKGTYNVCLVASNPCATDTFCDSIVVMTVGFGTDITMKENVSIYPNPSTGEIIFQVNLEHEALLAINVYHMTGQLILTEDLQGFADKAIGSVDLSGNTKGLYFLQIVTDQGVRTQRIVLR